MTRVGLLGGMSWQSTALYYRLLNESVRERVGGHASAPVTIHSVDFGEFEPRQRAGDWSAQGRLLADAATALERAGVAAVALATNTLHLVAEDIVAALSVPFVDLIDLVAAEVAAASTVGLLATDYTMTSDLYPRRLAGRGTAVLVPASDDRALVHRVIYDELVYGVVRPESRAAYRDVIARLVERGAQTVILGCTEIGLLIGDGDCDVAVLDTTRLHCRALTDIMVDGLPGAPGAADRVRSAAGARS
ncbi:MAG: aspartate/glutamate racemase family protein [Actinomycetota bacterium]|nr:aspartate/glutamate racemase family protein [Actinomycetota bacterium]